ncbi:hypothetical protein GW17_00043244 [Ensete ventricosum]|nr:hypothetical protein GW17_00043244 [Ensete ventricosum]
MQGGQPPVRGRPVAAMPLTRGGRLQWQQPRGHERLRTGRKGLLPMARPQGGGRLRPGPLQGAATRRGCGHPRAQTAVASPQGPSTHDATARGNRPQVAAARCKASRGSPVARATAYKGGRWQEEPPAGAAPARGGVASPRGATRGQQRLPQGRMPTPTTCNATTCAGQRRRRRRRWGQGEG